jgi:hypothetical protein
MMTLPYTTQLQAGLGMISETRSLLDLWEEEMSGPSLYLKALESGLFPNISARRLRNLVAECFGPRFLVNNARPAILLKTMYSLFSPREFEQILFVFACRANRILADFVREVYWDFYTSGHSTLSNDDARKFVNQANHDGKTSMSWSQSTIRRVAAYLTGCCADFGLLERGRRSIRKIIPCRMESRIATTLAYELHFSGYGDNRVISDQVWMLFGMDRNDVLNELKQLAMKGLFIVQSAGETSRIGWQCQNLKELANVLAQV